MDAVAAALTRLLADLPDLPAFLIPGEILCLVAAGAAFALRRVAAVRRLGDGVDAFLSGVLAVALLSMVLLSGLQILLRNLLDSGLLWIDPLLRHLVLVLAFVGALVATGSKRHVQINALGRLLRGVPRRVAGTIVSLGAGAICLALMHAALGLLRDELEFPEAAFLSIPGWAIVAIFPAAFVSLAYRFHWLAFAEAWGEAPEGGEGAA